MQRWLNDEISEVQTGAFKRFKTRNFSELNCVHKTRTLKCLPIAMQ